MNEPSASAPSVAYRVLARKYRPSTFGQLIGQEAMVRTLTNAIAGGRLAHAFMLTGVRGIGKTTTARLIARALNCAGGPTIEPCGTCEHCAAIAQDRHVDVMEMDAASRTGVDDIRELIEGVRYRPTSARYKIYIVDEVHMLSKNAFNALLKTLEEPPEHVKFIFATTEIRKVPVTVLSRCQRFDLRRVERAVLAAHFGAIAEKENAQVASGALDLIARAADGSVRDGLSLLDQAIAHGGGEVSEDAVRDMLGLADRAKVFDLFDLLMQGKAAEALTQLADLYAAGADPLVVVQDLLEFAHWLTRLKVAPEAAEGPAVSESERVRGRDMAGRLSMAALGRAWQMLLKGIAEVQGAPHPLQAAEMIVVRLTYAAELPTPAEAVRSLQSAPSSVPRAAPSAPTASTSTNAVAAPPWREGPSVPPGGPRAQLAAAPQIAATPDAQVELHSFDDVIRLTETLRAQQLRANLINNVHLVRFEPGRIEFRPGDHAEPELAHQLSRFLNEHTGRRWMVSVSHDPGQPTLHQQTQAVEAKRRQDVSRHPLAQAILASFPGAEIAQVRSLTPTADPDPDMPDHQEDE